MTRIVAIFAMLLQFLIIIMFISNQLEPHQMKAMGIIGWFIVITYNVYYVVLGRTHREV